MRERTRSPWMDTMVAPGAPRLANNLECDTVVVGAGMAGLSVAYELALAGSSVVVLDRGPIAGGMTSRTTAHLSPICDDGISALIERRGAEAAILFQLSQAAAVDRIEAIVRERDISCAFRRLDGYLLPALDSPAADAEKQLNREHDAARQVGAAVAWAPAVPFAAIDQASALRYPGQATFHPLAYLEALSAALVDKAVRIFANSAVRAVDETGSGVRVLTDEGSAVDAARAVVATNAPMNDRVAIHSKMAPYRTYAMAFALPRGALPDALYWDLADPYHYVRLQPRPDGTEQLIVGGADHKAGEADDGEARYADLTSWTRRMVPAAAEELYRWSGQVLEPIDYCGFIGRNPGNERIFVACGDSGQGITHGALAGLLLKDLILRGMSPWESVYDPSRKTVSGVADYLSENLTAIRSFAEYVTPGEIKSVEELQPGHGGILRDGVSLIAACRDRDGALHLHSASCTHLGCVVHWNSVEQCWDCPCHGSHFAPDGAVLNGPAHAPLAQLPDIGRGYK